MENIYETWVLSGFNVPWEVVVLSNNLNKEIDAVEDFDTTIKLPTKNTHIMKGIPITWKFEIPFNISFKEIFSKYVNGKYTMEFMPDSEQPFPVYPEVEEHIERVQTFITKLVTDIIFAEFEKGIRISDNEIIFDMETVVNVCRKLNIPFRSIIPDKIDMSNFKPTKIGYLDTPVYWIKYYDGNFKTFLITDVSINTVKELMMLTPMVTHFPYIIKLNRRNPTTKLLLSCDSIKKPVIPLSEETQNILNIINAY